MLQVHSLAVEMIGGGASLRSVQLMLSLANSVNPHKINVVEVVKEALKNCLGQLEQSR